MLHHPGLPPLKQLWGNVGKSTTSHSRQRPTQSSPQLPGGAITYNFGTRAWGWILTEQWCIDELLMDSHTDRMQNNRGQTATGIRTDLRACKTQCWHQAKWWPASTSNTHDLREVTESGRHIRPNLNAAFNWSSSGLSRIAQLLKAPGTEGLRFHQGGIWIMPLHSAVKSHWINVPSYTHCQNNIHGHRKEAYQGKVQNKV